MTETKHEPSFAQFLYGSVPHLKDAVAREGKRWAAQYKLSKTFPTPDAGDVPGDTLVWTDSVADLRPEAAQWRVYFARSLAAAINDALDWKDHAQVNADFEKFTSRFPWGALDAAVGHVFPNSVVMVSRRISAITAFWTSLDWLRYVDRDAMPIGLGQLMQNHYGSLLEMWLDRQSGDLQTDLKRAVEVMRDSSREDIRRKVIARLSQLAREDERIHNRERLSDPAWLDREVSKLEPEVVDNMATGYLPALLRNLIILDESIDGASRS